MQGSLAGGLDRGGRCEFLEEHQFGDVLAGDGDFDTRSQCVAAPVDSRVGAVFKAHAVMGFGAQAAERCDRGRHFGSVGGVW